MSTRPKHFNAADRHNKYHSYLGIPLIIINIFIGSLLFVLISTDLPEATKWIGATVSLLAVIIAGLQTFFDFNRNFQEHKKTSNKYLIIERGCDLVFSQYIDNHINKEKLLEQYKILSEKYIETVSDVGALSTKDVDFRNALRNFDKKQKNHSSLYDDHLKC